MKQCAEDMELKLQGNKQSVVYSGIKNIVKTSTGKKQKKQNTKQTKQKKYTDGSVVTKIF